MSTSPSPVLTKPEEQHSVKGMQRMFSVIAPRYDFITRTFSFGMDMSWKKRLVRELGIQPGMRVLDLACGTGDFSRLCREKGATAVGADLTIDMMRHSPDLRTPVGADAQVLPFRDGTFDAVLIGYGMRNFPDPGKALREIHRVLKPGGKLGTLDFFLPENILWRKLFLGYMHVQGAFWGLLLHGEPRIYTYIPRSLASFLTSSNYGTLLGKCGFKLAGGGRFILGAMQIHWAVRNAATPKT
ncbi:MAG: ubiquinone/menaquinone biosynthesis methyltransferase [Bryobacterales bacterium]|nr:ubiquinone/menaquinone biosynthesis methyltransferase [Bryobacterales bacterium]